MERVVITGMGAVTPVGLDLASTWASLVEGRSGAAPITLFDATDYAVHFACEVKNWEPTKFIERKKLKEMDRFIEFACGAAAMAAQDAGLELTDEERDEAGCFIGVGLGGLATLEKTKETILNKGPSKVSPYSIPAIIANLAAGQVSMAMKLRGPSYAVTSACSSGAHSIGEAVEWIRRGRAKVMVAGGAESTISPVGIGGFQAMYALSRRNDEPTRASRPFDKGRDGFVCGEGAGVLILESLSRALARGARIYAEVTGYGASSDAHHLTQPAPEGEGAQRAMQMALRDARLAGEAIGYVNAHGTSTPVGDKNECIAIRKVLGDRIGGPNPLAVSSTKSMTGHLLGAAGAIEAVFSAMTLHTGVIPPTINVDDQDPECAVDVVPNQARQAKVDHVMSNSFGFGGTNASLVLSRFVR
ncbi:MAG: beta-ketoacyl-ACP synthase II [Polyangiaceae bacterium]